MHITRDKGTNFICKSIALTGKSWILYGRKAKRTVSAASEPLTYQTSLTW